ncbi:MAG: hypothetical protein IKR46_03185 [Clostridia bacterium]|nr:hypothetical protein [Clostridia bacterium]
MPENIVVNTGYQSSRFVFKRDDEYFASINNAATEIIKSAFSTPKSAQEIPAEDWYSVLTAKSLYLNYSSSFTPSVFASLLGISEGDFPESAFSDIVISENGNVYFGENGKYYKIPSVSTLVSPIIQSVSVEHADEESVINYSFDLNFDKSLGDETTVLSPMILIYSEPVSARTVLPENPVIKDGEIYEKALLGILSDFGVNKSSARSYTEADGSLVYVENNGILKITADGILTFTARGNGIKLSSGSASSKIAGFIDSINGKMDIDADLCLSSTEAAESGLKLDFDYMVEGYPVKYADRSAISATVSGNYLVEYSQILRKFTVTENESTSSDFIQALDEVIDTYHGSMAEMRITKMFPSFYDDLSQNEMGIDWHINVDNVLAE